MRHLFAFILIAVLLAGVGYLVARWSRERSRKRRLYRGDY